MIRTNFALSEGSRSHKSSRAAEPNVRRGPLTCVWIPTGNPRQPLACVWTDRRETETEPALSGESRPHRGLFLVHA
jgi:hypothetical protein